MTKSVLDQSLASITRSKPRSAIASGAKQSIAPQAEAWIASSLRSLAQTLRVLSQAIDTGTSEAKGRQEIMGFFERLKSAASAEWRAYTEHPFTEGLADGSLAEAAFRHYLVQDYLFLIEFARAYALSVYKSPTLADMREAAAGISAILDVEMNLHVKLCAGWGLSATDLEQAPPAVEMLAYTRYVLDAGMRGDLLALKVALAPCVIGYAEIATRLAARPNALAATNPYSVWIAEYAGAPYQEVAAKARAHLEGLADLYATPAREAELIAIFKEATRLEADFWEMGWRVGKR